MNLDNDEYAGLNAIVPQIMPNKFSCFGIKCFSETGSYYEIKQMTDAAQKLYGRELFRAIESFTYQGKTNICLVKESKSFSNLNADQKTEVISCIKNCIYKFQFLDNLIFSGESFEQFEMQ